MNLDKKLELAQETLLKLLDKVAIPQDFKDSVSLAWVMTDAMEAEYKKRKKDLDAESKEFMDNVLKNNTHAYMNCDIQVMDEDGSFRVTTRQKELDDKEFQVDWSVAPEWASYWIKTSGKSYAWLSDKPEISEIIPHWNIECIQKTFAPSFDYQGDWKDSLRKRPQEKPKQHDCNCAHWKGGSFFMGDTFTCKDCGGSVTI